MIGTRRVAPRPIWAHLGSPTNEDWRSLVYAVGDAMDERSAPLHGVEGLDEEIAHVAALDADLAGHLRTAATEALVSVYDTSLVLGVALARTWPDRLEDLDAWPNRALALAQLERSAPERPARPVSETPTSAAPFEGETIADVLERSGAEAERPYEWLELVAQTVWHESPHCRAFDLVDRQIIDLLDRRAPVSTAVVGAIDDRQMDREVTAIPFAARLGYALGKYEHLPEAERLARARGLATLHPIYRPAGVLDADEWEALRRARPHTGPQEAPVPVPVLEQLAAWLAANYPAAGATPDAALATVLGAVPGLERLREPAAS